MKSWLILFLLFFTVYCSQAIALTNKEELILSNVLTSWDKNNSDNNRHGLIKLLTIYGVDSSLVNSKIPIDNFIEQELLFAIRDYCQRYESDSFNNIKAIHLRKFKEYLDIKDEKRSESTYIKLLSMFSDFDKYFTDTLNKNRLLAQQANEEENRRVALIKQKEQEEYRQAMNRYEDDRRKEQLAKQQKEDEFNKQQLEKEKLYQAEIEEESRKYEEMFYKKNAKAIKLGYKNGIQIGIYNTLSDIYQRDLSIKDAIKCLIESDESDQIFSVENLINDYVIFGTEYKRFALVKEKGKFYGVGTPIESGYYKVIGVNKFKTVLGVVNEVVILKKVKITPGTLVADK